MTARPRRGDPDFGPQCRCGGPKAKQARTCQRCHGLLRGYGTVPLREQNRRWRRTYMGGVTVVGDGDAAAVARAAALEQARTLADGELAVLVAEQLRDQRLGHIARDRWMVHLDDVDRYGRPLHEVLAR
jgi:hypothetical protein